MMTDVGSDKRQLNIEITILQPKFEFDYWHLLKLMSY